MPKAGPSRGTEEEGVLHGAINEEEATQHRQRLEEVFVAMEQKIKDEEEDALKEAIIGCKATITMIMPSMAKANPTIVLESIKDPSCLAIRPRTDVNTQKLEDMMPPAEVPTGQDMVTIVEDMKPLTDEQRRQISELFEDLELAHEQLARTCSSLVILSRSLTSRQLILLLKSSIRPLAQLNVAPGVFEEVKLGQQKIELPEEKFRQVRLMMVPVATSGRLAQEKPNIVTRLLVATLSFKVLNHFTDGTTQREQQIQ